jgi:hypothetical protein
LKPKDAARTDRLDELFHRKGARNPISRDSRNESALPPMPQSRRDHEDHTMHGWSDHPARIDATGANALDVFEHPVAYERAVA